MKITFNPENFDPGMQWVNLGHVLAAALLLAFTALLIAALI